MISAIIDLGSNTVRLSIYEWKNSSFTHLMSKKEMVGLASYIDNKKMSEDGILKACKTIKRFQSILSGFHIEDVHVFATAPLRNITNTQEIIERIYEECHIRVDAISGEEEARLDFFGAKSTIEDESGLIIDIGGGSTEVVYYEDGAIIQAVSINEGSLSLFHKYVEGLFPTKDEENQIKKVIKELFKDSHFDTSVDVKKVVGVGGTIRASYRHYGALISEISETKSYPSSHLKKLIKEIKNCSKQELGKLLKNSPERIHTILPGLIILETIVKQFNVEMICISEFGVREGYFQQKVMGK